MLDIKPPALLLHQFLMGVPHNISKQLRASGVTILPQAVERANILMTVEEHSLETPVAAAQPKPTELLQLQQQVSDLSVQVAALTIQRTASRPSQVSGESRSSRCYTCKNAGHLITVG